MSDYNLNFSRTTASARSKEMATTAAALSWSRLATSHVNLVDETRRTYRHYGRQRGAPRRTATFHHATLRVAPHRYATCEPLGTSRRLSRVSRGRPASSVCGSETLCEAKYMRADDFAASRRAVVERRYRPERWPKRSWCWPTPIPSGLVWVQLRTPRGN